LKAKPNKKIINLSTRAKNHLDKLIKIEQLNSFKKQRRENIVKLRKKNNDNKTSIWPTDLLKTG